MLLTKLQNNNEHVEINYTVENKLHSFLESYLNDPLSVAVLADFDWTLTKRYDYGSNKTLGSSYQIYDESAIGGSQKEREAHHKKLFDKYHKYEVDTSIDFKKRDFMLRRWYTESLSSYVNKRFTKDSIKNMIEKQRGNFSFRNYAKEFIESVIGLNIPFIVISAGLGDIIEGALRDLIPRFDEYVKDKKLCIISNKFKFNEKGECYGIDENIIYTFNKSHFSGNYIKTNFPKIKNVFIMGDNLKDYNATDNLNLEKNKIIGVGFVNILPEDKEKEKKINEFKNVYDINLIGDSSFKGFANLFREIKNYQLN